MAQEAEQKSKKRGNPRTTIGIVLKDKMDKTVVVGVTSLVKHRLYKKYIKRTKKYYAHDKENKAKICNKVKIIETKPISKTKRWRVLEVIEK